MWQLKLVSTMRRVYLATINFSIWAVNESDKKELKKYNTGTKSAETLRNLAVTLAQKAVEVEDKNELRYNEKQRAINAADNALRNLRDDTKLLAA